MNAREQVKMHEMMEKRAMNTRVLKDGKWIETTIHAKVRPGRPVNENSALQQRLRARQERINNGEVIKRGRPAGTANKNIVVNINDLLINVDI
jgi:hypothetical protein